MSNLLDYTEAFRKARKSQGLKPIRESIKIILVTEGLTAPCGCQVQRAGLSHFVICHNEDCKSPIQRKVGTRVVTGEPGRSDISAVLTIDDNTIGLTNPWLGRWPEE